MIRKRIIAYYGAFITDCAKERRNLPVLNHAASKRMLRVAQGLTREDRRCVILSPCLAPKIATTWRELDSFSQRVGGVAVLFIAQWGVRFLGYILTPITAIMAAVQLNKRHNIEIVVQYNYQPDAFIFSLWCKCVYRAKVILDLEDVSIPRLSDWSKGSEVRPLNEIWTSIIMKWSIGLADLVFAPSRKLGCVVKNKTKFLPVTGCQTVATQLDSATINRKKNCINILMSGGIKFENGIEVLADGVKLADSRGPQSRLSIKVCGPGKYEWLKDRLRDLENITVEYLGFLSNEEFDMIYRDIDICLALQKPEGRYGQFKAPSKGYEALCSGKALVVSEVGDFDLLPDETCFKLKPYSAERFSEILCSLTVDSVYARRLEALKYARQNFQSKLVGQTIIDKLSTLTR